MCQAFAIKYERTGLYGAQARVVEEGSVEVGER